MPGKKEYLPLLDENLDKAPNADKHGVYTIHWIASNNKGKSICRIARKDDEGTLYIGETHDQTLFERICDFRKAIDPNYKSENHSGGKSYNASEALKAMIKPEEMGVEMFAASDPEETETAMLAEYRNKFGELTPLNSQG